MTGMLLHRLTHPLADLVDLNYGDFSSSGTIEKLEYIHSRRGLLDAADLISVGTDGGIKFWNSKAGYLMWETSSKLAEPQPIGAMHLIQSIDTLITGDNSGVISIWDIKTLCLREEVYPLFNRSSILRILRRARLKLMQGRYSAWIT
jgi:WD40 repeat protein